MVWGDVENVSAMERSSLLIKSQAGARPVSMKPSSDIILLIV